MYFEKKILSLSASQTETDLIQKILTGYDYDARPVINTSHPVYVNVELNVTMIMNLV